MKHRADHPAAAARPRLPRIVIALLLALATLVPMTAAAPPAQAVSAGGATHFAWVNLSNRATDFWGNNISWNYAPYGWGGRVIYGIDNRYDNGRIQWLQYFAGNGGFMWAGNGYICYYGENCNDSTGGNGRGPRTLTVPSLDGGWVENKAFLENDCDYYGLTYAGWPGFNVGAQGYQRNSVPGWRKDPRWEFWGVGTPYANMGSWIYWANGDYTRYDDPVYGRGNTWNAGYGEGWYYACERRVTQRWLSFDTAPNGHFDSATQAGADGIRITGWAADRDRFAKTAVTVTVDGVVKKNAAPTNAQRTDAGNAMNGWYDSSKRFTDDYGFDFTLTGVSSGTHQVCVTALNVVPDDPYRGDGNAADSSLGCSTVLVNRPPVAVDDTATTWKKSAVTIDVLANDSDPDGDKITVTNPSKGTYGTTSVQNGKVVYTPNGVAGDVWDSFTYTVQDSNGATDTGTVSVWVDKHVGPNPGPVLGSAGTDDVSMLMGTTAQIRVLANDAVPSGLVGTSKISFGGLTSAPQHGSVTTDPATGTVFYTPIEHFTGIDSFTYASCLTNVNYSPETQCTTGTIRVSLTNRPSTAEDFTVTANPGQTIDLPFADHVADLDGDAITVAPQTQPQVGSKVLWNASAAGGAGAFQYTAPTSPTPGRQTTFTYVARDAFGGVSAVRTVTILLPYVVRPS